ncbi:hypothetical protein PUW79_07250 [Microbacterium sp. NE2HP2]|jgi:hypothetical protein|uniref:DUF7882 family protein n=1 Tax=Microbacterium TaxID=33882 RepID=UPI0022AF6B5D|nr:MULTISPECIES: hypothetical protein [Microbacterium]MDF2917384.1 hypothetical protein [Microbacterium sp.]MCZ4067520.1 hypothetical protein [Microbacterium sp. H37-C3]MDD7944422.1 hypothetical protein [Microbacterium plantarum]WHE36752.1 hypothetical protein P6897_03225 [Microbacterium sp. BDGP8]WRK17997.1 hypothetical protein VC184_02975 [Microbacterium plantarum]
MGQLHYGNSDTRIEIPDRLLAHLKVVIATKLRRNESFMMSWTADDGRSSIWLQPSIPLRFVFESADMEVLNPAAIRDMANAATSSAGLVVALDQEIPEAPQRELRPVTAGVPRLKVPA